MKTSRYTEKCGALVHDIQLSDLSASDLKGIQEAFIEHGLLLFRDQDLSPVEHLGFARKMGDIVHNKFFTPHPDFPDIALVKKDKNQETNIGGGWHTDHSYDAIPAKGSILVARELPASGGATHFANLYAAYEALSQGMKKTLSTLKAVHSNEHLYGKEGYYSKTDQSNNLTGENQVGNASHPVIITHPESLRKALYVNPAHTIHFEGQSRNESIDLLEYLYDHTTQPEFTCEFNWQPGSVVLWDNRCTWHFAQNDYQGQSRLMHRITLSGSPLS